MAFLQYKAGAIPGKPLKRKVTPEETRERKKQYEKEQECKFIDSWKQNDPGFITTLNKMLWSATGASKPMNQKSRLFKKNHYFIVGPVKSSPVDSNS